MSWGYWSIVAGLVVLVANLFVCLSLLYSGDNLPGRETSRTQGKTEREMPPASIPTKRAA